MHAERENRRFTLEEPGVAVPLMHVAVHDQYLLDGISVVSQGNICRHLENIAPGDLTLQ